jgi:hypothetical protein
MLCGEGIAQFQKLLKHYIAELASAAMHGSQESDPHIALTLEMHAQFMAGASVTLLAWWLEHDMPFSPHQMAQYLVSPHGMSSPAHSQPLRQSAS